MSVTTGSLWTEPKILGETVMGTWIAVSNQEMAHPKACVGVGTVPLLFWGAVSMLTQQVKSLSSGVVFGSLPLHFWPHQTCLTYETSLELYNYWSTNVCLFVKKEIIAPICKQISCLNPSIFYLVFCLRFPVLCNIYYPSPLFHQLLSSCYPILFVFFSFKFCLSTCSLSFQLQRKAVRGRSLIFAYLSKK